VRIGVTFPQNEITSDPGAVRAYAQAAEDLGYTHLLAYDHVVGADLTNRPNWTGPYNLDTLFHEVFVLFGYLAGITSRLELITGILILPQRQTVLVAKQAAEIDVLSGGKFRLGIGIGWNDVEYQALGENFKNRGKRSEEQITLLRRLFSEQSVTFHGRWHQVEAAGIKPMPVQRPIPIWLGGGSEATLRRVAAMGDGWLCNIPLGERSRTSLEQLRSFVAESGREPSSVGLEARVSIATKNPDEWAQEAEKWKALGATHLAVNTMNAGLSSPQAHIDAIRKFKEVVS
jgi:probable F420-dependent oxidoreductase